MRRRETLFAVLLVLAGGLADHAAGMPKDELKLAGENAAEIRDFIEGAEEGWGSAGEQAAVFLVVGMPPGDLQALKKEFLLENLSLAMKAKEEFPWARGVPEEVFLNDVLPYASLDETREAWRPEYYETCRGIVAGCKSTSEAAQALNREFFKSIKVHYNRGRDRPNQSPAESKAIGKASCTGLSIMLVDACRAVGVPARVAGTPLWTNKGGNHTWVEIYDGGKWHFTGADEYTAQGLNRGWFTRGASKALADDWKHAIWATSWKKTGSHFPMVWALRNQDVPAVNVTARYAKTEDKKPDCRVPVHVRVFDKMDGERIVARIEVQGADGSVTKTVASKAGTADMNDMATVSAEPGTDLRLRVHYQGEVKLVTLKVDGEATKDLFWSDLELGKSVSSLSEVETWLALLPEERHLSVPKVALSKEEAAMVTRKVFEVLKKEQRAERKQELKRVAATKDGSVKLGVVKAAEMEMKVLEKTFGKAPEDGPSLWISMHGGGGAPAKVNDQQWKNQIMLYQPEEGIYVAPRAPTDSWNLWHQGHMDPLLDRLIENYIIARGVNPDRVYLMGYSAGGDGVYQLAPRMADRFAGASMMAGHPGDASPLGLRNLPFMIWAGANDGAYNRNEVAAKWGGTLDALEADDPGGYVHETHVIKDKGHWMDRADAAAVPWMAPRTRQTWPKKLVWRQDGTTHDRFYWLAVPEGTARKGQTVRAEVEGQKIVLKTEGLAKVTLRLSDELVDLDKEVVVDLNGKEVFRGTVTRQTEAVFTSLQERLDPRSAGSAILELKGSSAAPGEDLGRRSDYGLNQGGPVAGDARSIP
jgi:hypothetical protein